MVQNLKHALKGKWAISLIIFFLIFSLAYVSERDASAKTKTYNLVVKIVGAKTVREGVEAAVTGGSLETPLTQATDKRGRATFRKLAQGTYTVTPTKEGYSYTPESMEVTLSK